MKSRTKLIVIVSSLAGLTAAIVMIVHGLPGSNRVLPPNTFTFTPVSASKRAGTIVSLVVTNRNKGTLAVPFHTYDGKVEAIHELLVNNGDGWRGQQQMRFAPAFKALPPGEGYLITFHLPLDAREWKIGVQAERVAGKSAVGLGLGELGQTKAGSRLIPDFVWSWFERPQLSDNVVWSDSFTLDSIPKSNKTSEIASIRELLQRLAKAKTTRAQLKTALSMSFPLGELSYYDQGSAGWRSIANIYGNARITARLSSYYSFALFHTENVTAWVYLRNDDEVDDFDIVDEEMGLPALPTTPASRQPGQK